MIRKLLQLGFYVYLSSSLLAGCAKVELSSAGLATETAQPTTTSQPPTSTFTITATPEPTRPSTPTTTPKPTPVLATSPDDILGTWLGLGRDGLYNKFNEDGTLWVAQIRDLIETNPSAVLTYRFDGTRLIITEVNVRNLPSCGPDEGIYEVQLLPGGNIKFVKIKDPCGPRGRSIALEHEPVR